VAGHGGGGSAVDPGLGGVAAHRQLLRAAPVPPGHRRVRARGGGGRAARVRPLRGLPAGARRLAYAVVGSSMGFGRYVGSMAVVEDEAGGCRLVWAFECEPVQGWSLDGLLGYLDGGVKAIAARIEEAEAAAAGAPPAGGDVDVVAAA